MSSQESEGPRSRLLTLPLEIRNHIYTALLQSTAIPPANAENLVTRPNTGGFEGHVRWSTLPPAGIGSYIYTSSSAILTCRQVHAEIYHLVSQQPSKFPYRLQLLIPNHYQCYPTWLALPAPLRLYNHGQDLDIDAEFTLAKKPTSESSYSARDRKLRWGSDGGPGEAQIMLLTVLGHWCTNGPLWDRPLPGSGRNPDDPSHVIRARKLRMHFVPSDPRTPCTVLGFKYTYGETKVPDIWGRVDGQECHQYLHCRRLESELRGLATNGLLYGRFSKLSLDIQGSEAGPEDVWEEEVHDCDPGRKKATSAEWAGYGWLPGHDNR